MEMLDYNTVHSFDLSKDGIIFQLLCLFLVNKLELSEASRPPGELSLKEEQRLAAK